MSTNGLLIDPRNNSLSDHPVTKEILKIEQSINSNNFNAFEVHNITKKNSLYFIMQYVFQKFEFNDQLKINSHKYQTFSIKMQSSYRENPYHTSIHAADVV